MRLLRKGLYLTSNLKSCIHEKASLSFLSTGSIWNNFLTMICITDLLADTSSYCKEKKDKLKQQNQLQSRTIFNTCQHSCSCHIAELKDPWLSTLLMPSMEVLAAFL